MKRALYVLLFVTGMSQTQDVHHHHHSPSVYPVIVDATHQEPDYYSRQWLYEFAASHPGFAYTSKVQKNLEYYIKMVTTHIARLTKKIEQGSQSTVNKQIKGANLTALGAVMAIGGVGLVKYADSLGKEYEVRAGLMAALGMISATISVVPLILGPKALYKSVNYSDRLQKRLERAQRILAELQQAQTA